MHDGGFNVAALIACALVVGAVLFVVVAGPPG